MPLTTCPDCQREISDQALACPHCGRPVPIAAHGRPPSARGDPPAPLTIEATSKQWKSYQAAGAVVMMVGVVLLVALAQTPSGGVVGALGLFVGLTLFLIGRVGAWWHNR